MVTNEGGQEKVQIGSRSEMNAFVVSGLIKRRYAFVGQPVKG
jgi:hypothetical protein